MPAVWPKELHECICLSSVRSNCPLGTRLCARAVSYGHWPLAIRHRPVVIRTRLRLKPKPKPVVCSWDALGLAIFSRAQI